MLIKERGLMVQIVNGFLKGISIVGIFKSIMNKRENGL